MKAQRTVVLAVLAIGVLVSGASAEDLSWLAPVSGNWSDGTKWDVGHAPVAGDNVFISNPGGPYTVTLNVTPPSLAGLTVGDTTGMGGPTFVTNGRPISSTGLVLFAGSGRLQGGCTFALSGAGAIVRKLSTYEWDFDFNALTISGGRFEYGGGGLIDQGSITLSGATLQLDAALTNTGTMNVTNTSMVTGETLTNQGTLSDFGNGANPVFGCPVVNATGGMISIQTGNGSSIYRFEHAEGLVNMGTITAGSTGNGSNSMTVPNGPFRNEGMFNTRDSRGGPIVVTAELINEPGATFQNTPGVGARLLVGRAGAHHVNRGTFRGVESVTQSGMAPSFRQEAGLIDLAGSLAINGGTFEYVGGSITGGTLSLNGVQVILTNAYSNAVTLNVANGSVVDGMTLTNNGTVSDFSNAAGPRFLCPFVNGPMGLISIQTGNSFSDYRFEHITGLRNEGRTTAGSTGNGSNSLTVPNGPFTNVGTFDTRDSRGGPIVVTAELINEPGATFENTPGVGARLLLGKAGAHHVNRGTFRGVESVTQSGMAPSFRQETGVIDLTGSLTIAGGTFEYVGGSITGGGTLSMSGAQMILTNPYENLVPLNVANSSVVSGMTLTNRSTLFDSGNAADALFQCPVVNGPTGLIRIATGNSGSSYRFLAGLTNDGTVLEGSTGNGGNTVTVSGGSLVNRGMIRAVNSRGGTVGIIGTVVNEVGGTIETGAGEGVVLYMEALQVNRGLIQMLGGPMVFMIPGGSTFTNETTGVVRAVSSSTSMQFITNNAPHALPSWFVNRGLVEAAGADTGLSITSGLNRRIDNDPTGTMRATAGTFTVANAGGMRNLGTIEVRAQGVFRIVGPVPDNFVASAQGSRWDGGRLIIEGPGQFCTVVTTALVIINGGLECLHEAGTCTSVGTMNFGSIAAIGPEGSFELNDMPMTTAAGLDVQGDLMITNGAQLTVQGELHCTGHVAAQGGTVSATMVRVDDGECGGSGQYNCPVDNHGGRCRPGQSPGRFQTSQSYTQGVNATLEIEIGGHTQGTEYDVLVAGTSVTLNGTLEVLLINSFVPSPGDQFIIVQAASVSGMFSTVTMPPGLYVQYLPTEVRVFSPCPGDWNHSNATSVQDIFDFLASYFAGMGDFNHSGETSVQDIFDFLAAYFGSCP